MNIRVTDYSNNIKTRYDLRLKVSGIYAFLNKFNWWNPDNIFIFINESDKYIIIDYNYKCDYYHHHIKILISGLTDNTIKTVKKAIKRTFYNVK